MYASSPRRSLHCGTEAYIAVQELTLRHRSGRGRRRSREILRAQRPSSARPMKRPPAAAPLAPRRSGACRFPQAVEPPRRFPQRPLRRAFPTPGGVRQGGRRPPRRLQADSLDVSSGSLEAPGRGLGRDRGPQRRRHTYDVPEADGSSTDVKDAAPWKALTSRPGRSER
jgi:hypothetical protein